MGKLKWDVNYVHNQLDQLELVINKLQPTIDEVEARVTRLNKAKGLPQYVTQRLGTLQFTNKATAGRLLAGVRSVRDALPEVDRKTLNKLPRLRTGNRYKVVLGGATLSYEEVERYYHRPVTRHLYVGDIILYRGHYKLEDEQVCIKHGDIFEIDGFVGSFSPAVKGFAYVNYLAKAK